jgi:hypothetical protein
MDRLGVDVRHTLDLAAHSAFHQGRVGDGMLEEYTSRLSAYAATPRR